MQKHAVTTRIPTREKLQLLSEWRDNVMAEDENGRRLFVRLL